MNSRIIAGAHPNLYSNGSVIDGCFVGWFETDHVMGIANAKTNAIWIKNGNRNSSGSIDKSSIRDQSDAIAVRITTGEIDSIDDSIVRLATVHPARNRRNAKATMPPNSAQEMAHRTITIMP
ncbi:hypothetical protein NYR55_09885 [Sphingomonas sp. BGYR3]|uniref:hypothetical protein n=1 Tax=Sphingomonas sp. BGYR3 TaxID=2975483 RepID=UPI0021A2E243|nr:hypothetical protein [Sphingomonas sp. BGYR3]MDG5488923.1 hypothetical protein [Sphingomonas sp. BGYR3]